MGLEGLIEELPGIPGVLVTISSTIYYILIIDVNINIDKIYYF